MSGLVQFRYITSQHLAMQDLGIVRFAIRPITPLVEAQGVGLLFLDHENRVIN